MFDFYYNGKAASELGVLAVKRPDIPSPERRITTYTVPGRNGILSEDEGTYEPVTIPVECNFMADDENSFKSHWRKIKQWLNAKALPKLSFTDDSDFYYKVVYAKISSPARKSKKIGTFTAEFICEPFEYLKSGDEIINVLQQQVIINDYYDCEPVYNFSGNGVTNVTVNGNTVRVNVSDNLTIDTALLIAYRNDGLLLNQDVSGDLTLIRLRSGDNEILFNVQSGDVSLNIIPKWRCL